ncbi:peptidoglycan-binding domain-containing protein [Aquimarina mytili]|uniref:Peptidoglycan-binding protein n=1 Tax=Aquimarina mytili TaxID=874423 RepID=A0A936ZZ54_9FLAO|nr:peptidoglycan-binding protein [Aquimarina mytili]MBL0682115.1 peptidoglycan-binding protein [Aquimarina mytili]
MSTIFLGSCDIGKKPTNTKEFLAPYHYLGVLKGTKSFRDDDRSKWRRFREVAGNEVTDLQQFLFKAGFMPRGVIDGVFDYVTQASTRLFQEYVRTIEGEINMIPDGIIGPFTRKHIDRWKASGKVSEWGQATTSNASEEYKKWMNILQKTKTHYQNNHNAIVSQIALFNKISDTRKVKDWDFNPNEIHLIGIRRAQDVSKRKRDNDDIFILLINGMVFKFWGSTDPSQTMAADRSDEAFLVEGQHKYRFGWHKISSEAKVYRALRPYQHGVLVFRDRDDDNALTKADLLHGIDAKPNNTINIHWSGIGESNWSAGCQVLVGKSYINHLDRVIDCSGFAAKNYSTLNDINGKTKGAYNLCADLILSFAKPGVDYIYYTLGRESSLDLDTNLMPNYASVMLNKMKKVE